MKIKTIYLFFLIFLFLFIGFFLGKLAGFTEEVINFKGNSHKNKINKLIDFIDNEYVDSVNTDSIVNLAIDNILQKLDPHSVYVPPMEQTEIAESMKGDFVGIGVNFFMYNDTVAIVKPVEGGPSEKAGIISGDRILYANKTKLFGRKLPNDSLYAILKGDIGSSVNLIIYRKSLNKKLLIRLKRDVVSIKSVDIATMLNTETGYIKINRFAETTYDEFRSGLEKLKKQGAKSLVIDVRDNGGGYLEKAIEVIDELLKDKQLIVFTKNKKGQIDKTYATEKGIFETGKLAILIDENSASASEILAGAIQDNDRGTIIGRRSFGKGLVQREMNFNDGSAVRLTVARYYTPTGRSIQKPYVKGNDDYFEDFDKRVQSGELYKKDSIKVDDTLKYKTKKGKIVYGGGGIVPDVFVPLGAELGEEAIAYLLQSGLVSFFVFEQLDRHRKEFTGLSYSEFVSKMDKSDLYFNNFERYLTKNGLTLKLRNHKAQIKRDILAEFGNQLFGEKKYYDIILKDDAVIKAALKSIKNP
jgi:carboxyl-terminal processing protease